MVWAYFVYFGCVDVVWVGVLIVVLCVLGQLVCFRLRWLGVLVGWFCLAGFGLVGLVFVMIVSDLLGVAFVCALVCFCTLWVGFDAVLIWLIVLLLGAVLLPFM